MRVFLAHSAAYFSFPLRRPSTVILDLVFDREIGRNAPSRLVCYFLNITFLNYFPYVRVDVVFETSRLLLSRKHFYITAVTSHETFPMSQVVLEHGRVQRLFHEQEDKNLISASGHRKVYAWVDIHARVCFSMYVRVSAHT